ncbi:MULTISPECIES: hypothetical protein [unclassified Bartonella]|uniref:hypothetical protein n=2 Tax=unclassified Bartonella TaxID=2645622 RepID=UPI0035CEEBC2
MKIPPSMITIMLVYGWKRFIVVRRERSAGTQFAGFWPAAHETLRAQERLMQASKQKAIEVWAH